MSHPWKEISLNDYEQHMRLASVGQLQALNTMMKSQLEAYPARTAMILGIAGGNGLEHVQTGQYDTVYGVDINEVYLKAAAERHPRLWGILQCLCLDLAREADRLPRADLVIADLLIEYIGFGAFRDVIRYAAPSWVSCIIQINTDETGWVSDSPYLHVFDRLNEVHHPMEANRLTAVMKEAGFGEIFREPFPLPNHKQLLRLDYRKNS